MKNTRTNQLVNTHPELQGIQITKILDRCNMTEDLLGEYNSLDEYFEALPAAEVTGVDINGTVVTLYS